MDRHRIQPYDRKRWFQIHCCRSTVKANPLPTPDLGMGLGLAMIGLVAVLAVGALIHFGSVPASAAVLATVAPVALTELQGKIDNLLALHKDIKEKGDELEKKYGALPANVAEQLTAIQKQVDEIDKKLIEHHSQGQKADSLEDVLKEDGRLQDWLKNHRGVLNLEISGKHMQELMERKTLIDTAAIGNATSGIIGIDRTAGIVQEARQALRMRDVLSSRPTSLPMIDYIKVNAAPSAASLQTEGSAKGEAAVTFTTATAYVKTIATWIPMTRQAMDDFSELMGYIRLALPYYVRLREEIEFLHGGGGSTDILGLVPQASALQTALALPAYNKSDLISAAIQQIEIANEVDPTFVVLHPTDYWQILRTKNANRDYVFNNNNITLDPFWGLTPVRTNKMGAGNFLVGSGLPVAAEIRDRMGMEIAISTEHASFFIENKVAVRAEERTTLVTYRPGAFVFGSFTTSP
jgi:HK97 family phage major capsid protein